MKYPHYSIDADIGLFIAIGVFLLVGLYNAFKLGYIQKRFLPFLMIAVIALITVVMVLR